jgi:hypothetical protein
MSHPTPDFQTDTHLFAIRGSTAVIETIAQVLTAKKRTAQTRRLSLSAACSWSCSAGWSLASARERTMDGQYGYWSNSTRASVPGGNVPNCSSSFDAMADGCVGDPGTSRCLQLRPKLLTANGSHRGDEHASKGITKPIRQEINVKI